MKKKLLLIFSGLFLLAACAGNGDEETMNRENEENRMEQTDSVSSSPMEIVGTNEYGRGAESDGQDTNRDEEPMKILTEQADSIIIYFSRSWNTENLVKMIHNETNADILELTLVNPYPEDYEETVERANEERETNNFPEISTDIPNLSPYNHIYLGYQTWAMTLSNPIIRFLDDYGDLLDGKIIHPFSSNAGYGEGNSLTRMQDLLPNSTIEESFAVEDAEVVSSENELVEWIKNQ